MISRLTTTMLLLFCFLQIAFPQSVSTISTVKSKATAQFDLLQDALQQKSSSNTAFQQQAKRMNRIGLLLFGCLETLGNQDLYGRRDREAVDKYLAEIDNYNELVRVAGSMNAADSVQAVLDYIEEDLKIKYDVPDSLGNSDDGSEEPLPSNSKARLVRVKVRVLDASNKEQMGYLVYVKPEISLNPMHVEHFNPTNNAVKDIAPGRKLIWIEKNGKRFNERREGIRRSEQTLLIDFVLN